MIAVVDYGMGNLRSVEKGLERVGAEVTVTEDVEAVRRADGIVLPGQGSFGTAMRRLEGNGLADVIREGIDAGKPFLGVCLGLQVLFDRSDEAPGVPGLGILPGTVTRFNEGLKVPHMGWNQLEFSKQVPHFRDLEDGDFVYFVHSYYAVPADESDVAAWTDYGVRFAAAVSHDNVCAAQFHPEKSQELGLTILAAYRELVARS